jgi:hypothetical protein
MHWKRYRTWLIPLLIVAVIKIFSFFPEAVEKYYSTGIYPVISRVLRILFGWIPFSMGDILYTVCFIYLILSLINFLSRAFRRELHRQYLILSLKKCFSITLWIYLAFNILWGLNYDRLPISRQMQLETRLYSKEELQDLVGLLVSRVNGIDSASRIVRKDLTNNDSIFRNSIKHITSWAGQTIGCIIPTRPLNFLLRLPG